MKSHWYNNIIHLFSRNIFTTVVFLNLQLDMCPHYLDNEQYSVHSVKNFKNIILKHFYKSFNLEAL